MVMSTISSLLMTVWVVVVFLMVQRSGQAASRSISLIFQLNEGSRAAVMTWASHSIMARSPSVYLTDFSDVRVISPKIHSEKLLVTPYMDTMRSRAV